MKTTVKNEWGVEIDFDTAVNLMDEDIRETLNYKMAPCTDQEFFDEYAGELEEEYKQQLKHEVETSDDGPLVNWDMDLVTFEGDRYVIEYIL